MLFINNATPVHGPQTYRDCTILEIETIFKLFLILKFIFLSRVCYMQHYSTDLANQISIRLRPSLRGNQNTFHGHQQLETRESEIFSESRSVPVMIKNSYYIHVIMKSCVQYYPVYD